MKIKLGKMRTFTLAWTFIKLLSEWYVKASEDGKIQNEDFSDLWLVFSKMYTLITGKEIEVSIPKIASAKKPISIVEKA